MPFTPRDWKDGPDSSTPLSAANIEDLETRLAAYADSVAAGGTGGTAAVSLTSVTTGGTVYKQGFESGTVTGTTHRQVRQCVVRAGGIVLAYGSWGRGGSYSPANDILVEAAIEHPNNGKLFRAYCPAGKRARIGPLDLVEFKAVGIEIPDGEHDVAVWTWVGTDADGGEVPSTEWQANSGTQEWTVAGNPIASGLAGTLPTPAYPSTYQYGPVGVFAERIDPADADVIACIGDSNTATRTGANFFDRAVDQIAGACRAKLAAGGASVTQYAQPGTNDSNSTDNGNPTCLFRVLPLTGATVVVIALGTNDLGANQSAVQIVGLLDEMAQSVRLLLGDAVPIVMCTVPPNTTSSDNYVTTANQAVTDRESIRTGINDAVRAGLDSVDWVADTASAVEANTAGALTLNGGVWIMDGGATGSSFGEGPHYTESAGLGAAAASVVLLDALQRVISGQRGGISQGGFTPPTPAAPAFTAAPAVSGSAPAGSTLTRTLGTVTGYPIPTRTTQWRKNGAAISGQTAATYVTVSGDVGAAIDVLVTASNGVGSNATSDSNDVTVTAAAPALDPAVTFDRGYGIGSELGAVDSTITAWGHTLSLTNYSDGSFMTVPAATVALPVVKTVNGKKVARFDGDLPQHLGAVIGSAETMAFEVWVVCKHAQSYAGHVSRFFSPNGGSQIAAHLSASAAFPLTVSMSAGDTSVDLNPTSLPSAWHVWRFRFQGSTGKIEVDGAEVASGTLGGAGTLTGFHLGSDFYGSFASAYDVAAWGIAGSELDDATATAALAYLTALMP